MTTLTLRWVAKNFVKKSGLRSFRHIQQIRRTDRPSVISGFDGACNLCKTKLAIASNFNANYSDHAELSWKRPEGPPRVWHLFEGRKKSNEATTPKFTIQDVPEEMVNETVEFMLRYIPNEELFMMTLGIGKDPRAMEEMRKHWRQTVRQGISIVTLATNEKDPRGKPLIVGANILTVITAQDKAKSRSIDQFKSKSVKQFWGMVYDLEDEVNVLTKHGVDKYLGSIGLLVHPSFRGHGIGKQMLKVREDIGRAYGIAVTEAMFTMRASQISASRAGFELQFEKRYSEILDYEGNSVFPEETEKFVHVMTKRLF